MAIRAGMFIDVQNVQSTFERHESEVRYDKLMERIRDLLAKELALESGEAKRALWKAVAFVPYHPKDQKRERLINALSFMGYRVRTKQVKKLPDGSIKANMDLEMTLEIMASAPYLDLIILVTGDSDFVPLIDALNRMGKKVWVVGTKKGSVGIELIRSSDLYKNMDDEDMEGVLIPFTIRSEPEVEQYYSQDYIREAYEDFRGEGLPGDDEVDLGNVEPEGE